MKRLAGSIDPAQENNADVIDIPLKVAVAIDSKSVTTSEAARQVADETAQQILTQGSPDITYLQDSSVKIEGITFYGSPWTPTFFDWHFMADRGPVINEKWNKIPEGIDVLITHGPPATILDNVRGVPQGCSDLLERILQINPKYNVFGHIHEGYGITKRNSTIFINASVCDGRYRPINKRLLPLMYSIEGSPFLGPLPRHQLTLFVNN